jgi:hypothetical protein
MAMEAFVRWTGKPFQIQEMNQTIAKTGRAC